VSGRGTRLDRAGERVDGDITAESIRDVGPSTFSTFGPDPPERRVCPTRAI